MAKKSTKKTTGNNETTAKTKGASQTIASAYVQILPSTQGLGAALAREINGALSQAEARMASLGTEFRGILNAENATIAAPEIEIPEVETPPLDGVAEAFGEAGEGAGAALMGGVTDVLGSAATVAAIAAPAAIIGKRLVDGIQESLRSYASAEQLTGGMETLFGDAAEQVGKYAADAYKTAGLDANSYMETVTSFSAALLKSLEGDTQRAAVLSDLALTDMADNANKMGSDISSIQVAYSGFARGIYTTLDNLKLGYSGTKSGMEDLLRDAEALAAAQGDYREFSIENYADIIEAIHLVQTEMGITGTTALEAEKTIEGSTNALKAAWSNLIAGLGSPDADLMHLTDAVVDSAKTAAENVAPVLVRIVTSPLRLVEQMQDPARQVETAISDIAAAQESIAKSENIKNLIAQYDDLRVKLEASGTSELDAYMLEQDLKEVREQLATATGNAAIAELGYGDALNNTVETEGLLADLETERSNLEIYKSLKEGAEDYQKSLEKIGELESEVTAAQALRDAAFENGSAGVVTAAETAADAIEAFREKVNSNYWASLGNEVGLEERKKDLEELEALYTSLTGREVNFTAPQSALYTFDHLKLSVEGLSDANIYASESYLELEEDLQRTTQAISDYEAKAIDLVENGVIPAAEAANMMGISLMDFNQLVKDYHDSLDAEAAEEERLAALAAQAAEIEAAEAYERNNKALLDLVDTAADAISSGLMLDSTLEELKKQYDEAAESGDAAAKSLAATALAQYESTLKIRNIVSDIRAAAMAGTDLRAAYTRIASALDDVGETGDAAARKFAETALEMLNHAATAEELADNYPGLVSEIENLGYSLDTLSDYLNDNEIAVDDWAKSVTSGISGTINGFDRLDTSLHLSLRSMLQNLQKNAEASAGWNQNLEYLMASAQASGDQNQVEFVKYLKNQGVSNAKQVAQMAAGDTESILAAFASQYSAIAASSIQSAYDDTAWGNIDLTDSAVQATRAAIAALDASAGWEASGIDFMRRTASGVDDGAGSVSDSVRNAVLTAKESALDDAAGFRDVGKAISDNIAAGVENADTLGLVIAQQQQNFPSFASERVQAAAGYTPGDVTENAAPVNIDLTVNVDNAEKMDAWQLAAAVRNEVQTLFTAAKNINSSYGTRY